MYGVGWPHHGKRGGRGGRGHPLQPRPVPLNYGYPPPALPHQHAPYLAPPVDPATIYRPSYLSRSNQQQNQEVVDETYSPPAAGGAAEPRRRSYQEGQGSGGRGGGEDDDERGEGLADLHDGDDDEEGRETHAVYIPARLKGGRPHPGHIVESKGLSSTDPPPIHHKIKIPRHVLDSGLLSILQIEAVLYACQQHESFLPNGERAAFALGDSTGVGKGRILAGIMWENLLRGRDRAVWITASPFLASQIKRDCKDIGLRMNIHELREQKLKGNVDLWDLGPGLMIVTYRTLLYKEQGGMGVSRVDQLISWLGGEDFDGVWALDESHKAKNLVAENKSKGGKTSMTAKIIFDLQKRLPQARVVYSSATLATCSQNLECLSRLGLWGPSTSFESSAKFSEAMKDAGLPALELVALDLKRQGKYLARTLGYKDADFEVVKCPMPNGFEEMYNKCALQWEELRQDLLLLVPKGSARLRRRKRRKNGEVVEEEEDFEPPTAEEKARANIWKLFWSYAQRFWSSLFVASKVPFVIEESRKAIRQGQVVIIGLQATGESQIRASQSALNGEEDFATGEVSQAQGIFEGLLKKHIVDGLHEGAREVRERHLAWLKEYAQELPRNPLDELIDAFGSDEVAELTGRTLRLINGKYEKTNISQEEHERARRDFQEGRKKVAIISEAASVGISLHSDRREETRYNRRVHFILELSWGADRCLQQLGRSHRSNQETGPIYRLIASEKLGGDVRFACTVARRLQSLGAITQGHEGASNSTLDLRDYNGIESTYGDKAIARVMKSRTTNDVRLEKGLDILASRGDESMSVTQFFNTVLGLELDIQRKITELFFSEFWEIVKTAKLDGSYDGNGIINVRGEAVERKGPVKKYIVRSGVDGKEESCMRLVTLTLDRGISYDQALEMFEQTGRETARGRDGFYIHNARPMLAIQRGMTGYFKLIRPDLGRGAYQDKTVEELLRFQYLTPAAAEAPWTKRFQDALTFCIPHQRERCCEVGKRLRTTYLLTFQLTSQWNLIKKITGRKRPRLIRAETTTAPVQRFVGVMLTKISRRRLEEREFEVVDEPDEITLDMDDEAEGKVDVEDLLEDEEDESDDGLTYGVSKRAAGGGGGGDRKEVAVKGGGLGVKKPFSSSSSSGRGGTAAAVKAKGEWEEEEEAAEVIDLVSSDGDLASDTEDEEDEEAAALQLVEEEENAAAMKEERALLGYDEDFDDDDGDDDDDIKILEPVLPPPGAIKTEHGSSASASSAASSHSTTPRPVKRERDSSASHISIASSQSTTPRPVKTERDSSASSSTFSASFHSTTFRPLKTERRNSSASAVSITSSNSTKSPSSPFRGEGGDRKKVSFTFKKEENDEGKAPAIADARRRSVTTIDDDDPDDDEVMSSSAQKAKLAMAKRNEEKEGEEKKRPVKRRRIAENGESDSEEGGAAAAASASSSKGGEAGGEGGGGGGASSVAEGDDGIGGSGGSAEGVKGGGGGEGSDEDELRLALMYWIDDLWEEEIVTKAEAKELRRRAMKKDELLYDAFYDTQGGGSLSLAARGHRFRKAVGLS